MSASRPGASGASVRRPRPRNDYIDASPEMVFGLKTPPGPLFERHAEPAETHHFRFRHLGAAGRFVERLVVLVRGVPRHFITVDPAEDSDTAGVRCDCLEFIETWDCPHVSQAIHMGHVRGFCHAERDPLPARHRGVRPSHP